MLDSTIVGLALPAIQRELDASASGLQWVMNGYLLVIAALVVTCGRLGDIYGRRAVFTIGLAVFDGGGERRGSTCLRRRAGGLPWTHELIRRPHVRGFGHAR
jgi:MFS family permease